jgi:hypothetical protein
MSLRTRLNSLPGPAEPGPVRRPRAQISQVPQPREDRTMPTWRHAKPARIAAALATAQKRTPVAGSSLPRDVMWGMKDCTIAGREVVFWRNSSDGLVAGPGACPHRERCWTAARCRTGRCTAAGTAWR